MRAGARSITTSTALAAALIASVPAGCDTDTCCGRSGLACRYRRRCAQPEPRGDISRRAYRGARWYRRPLSCLRAHRVQRSRDVPLLPLAGAGPQQPVHRPRDNRSRAFRFSNRNLAVRRELSGRLIRGHRKLGLPAADAGFPGHNRHPRCARCGSRAHEPGVVGRRTRRPWVRPPASATRPRVI